VPTAPTITGARGTGNVQQANRRPDIKSQIMDLQPEDTPFVVLLDKLPARVTGNPEFAWFEQDLEPRFDTTTATATNVATIVNVQRHVLRAARPRVRPPHRGDVPGDRCRVEQPHRRPRRRFHRAGDELG
jgi:hypothetical protein